MYPLYGESNVMIIFIAIPTPVYKMLAVIETNIILHFLKSGIGSIDYFFWCV